MENNKQNACLFVYQWVDENGCAPEHTGHLTDMVMQYAEKCMPDVIVNTREQNERMRLWFAERTGLKDMLLSEQMAWIDAMLKRFMKNEITKCPTCGMDYWFNYVEGEWESCCGCNKKGE